MVDVKSRSVLAGMIALAISVAVPDLLPPKQTDGWFGLAAYAGGVLSPSARADDASVYTHKLDLGGVATVGAFNWMPKATWLLDDARGLSLQAGLTLPIVPTPR
jgi:hypothetical protein